MREFTMAKHFDDIDEYGSAKFYYGQVHEELSQYASWPTKRASASRRWAGCPIARSPSWRG